MENYEDHGLRSFLIKGLIIIAIALVFLFMGGIFTVGIIAAANDIPPRDLLRGQISQIEEPVLTPRPQETEEQADPEQLPGLSEIEPGQIPSLMAFDEAISQIADMVTPSVVNIRVQLRQEDVFGSEIFGEGVGSGVIYSEDGYIITNSHLVQQAEEMLVQLHDGTDHPAELIGADPNTDVAVLKIETEGLRAADFTSIENVDVGAIAIAIGSPFGLEQTVTMGVVSAKGREIAISTDTLPMVDLIQTDASINQGNSGGPLVNSAGQVIGINTLIISPEGASAGVGFAVPSDTAVNIAQQIIRHGRAKIPFMGIEMGENRTDIIGVYIADVMDGYPAQQAGMEGGDVIVKFNDVEVKTPYELLAQMLRRNVGDEIELEIYRDGEYFTLSMVLVETPQ